MTEIIDTTDVLRLRAEGKDYGEIAQALGCSRATAHAHVQRAIEDARRNMAGIAQERLAVADARVEWMIDTVAKAIARDAAAASPFIDDKKYKIVIGLLERQAKMLGYDRERQASGETGDWMATASNDALKDYAEKLGLRVPSAFD